MLYTKTTKNKLFEKFIKENLMKNILYIALTLLAFSGCSATWNGVKEDTNSATNWSKKQVNDGAGYVQEKTK